MRRYLRADLGYGGPAQARRRLSALHRRVSRRMGCWRRRGRSTLSPLPTTCVTFAANRRPQGLALGPECPRGYHAGGGSLRSFSVHRIRHARATLLANNGMPLEEVSRCLGHSSTVRRDGSTSRHGRRSASVRRALSREPSSWRAEGASPAARRGPGLSEGTRHPRLLPAPRGRDGGCRTG
jgi:hypothetical protein